VKPIDDSLRQTLNSTGVRVTLSLVLLKQTWNGDQPVGEPEIVARGDPEQFETVGCTGTGCWRITAVFAKDAAPNKDWVKYLETTFGSGYR
jgi:hypothetical protein